MNYLPFYHPSGRPPNIVIVGSGYAGIAALSTFRRHCPTAQITVIDENIHHVRITHLHKTFRQPLADFRVPLAALQERFNFHHIHAKVAFDDESLARWDTERALTAGEEHVGFDFLLIATGSSPFRLAEGPNTFGLDDFASRGATDLLREAIAESEAQGMPISIVGGGATGIQFLFELALYARREKRNCPLRLIDSGAEVLGGLPPEMARYVRGRMAALDIAFLNYTLFREQHHRTIALENSESGESFEVPSAAALVFIGKVPEPLLLTSASGQVNVGGSTLTRIYAAGDCCHHQGLGSNAMTAQNALRKGWVAARNILRASGRVPILEPYVYQDMGYLISLGPEDAIGWVGLRCNVVAGYPAMVLKEFVEAQYDLLLTGTDTYII
jgi:NADH dehydrogenase